MWLLLFAKTAEKQFGNKYGKQILDTATKTELDAAKTASKRVIEKIAEVTSDFIGNKIVDKSSNKS